LIDWSNIAKLLGYFILGLAFSLLPAISFAFWNGDAGLGPLLWALVVPVTLGCILVGLLHLEPAELTRRDAILLVVSSWVAACLIGALPFYFSDYPFSFVDAVFESTSGFTTTGSTVLADIEALPESLLLWRSLIHWLGGMGIILLGIAILPLLGTGGMQLYRAEFSGARSEKLKPRVAEVALALWKIYASLTLVLYILLRLLGMSRFDAACHSFSTMATGGFSTRALSIEAFASPSIEYVIVVFMILASINFTLHFRLFSQGDFWAVWKDTELRFSLGVVVAATAAVYISLSGLEYTSAESFRLALFQVVSIVTTTGYSSADFETWPPLGQFTLLALMLIGGSTGSTAGGLKAARVLLLLRVVQREFRKMAERRGVFAVRLSGEAVDETTIQSLLNLVYLALVVNVVACIALTATGVDILTSITAVTASMFNVGPAFGQVGPTEHFGHLPVLAKWVLSLCMLAGRLEFFTFFVIFAPLFWRK